MAAKIPPLPPVPDPATHTPNVVTVHGPKPRREFGDQVQLSDADLEDVYEHGYRRGFAHAFFGCVLFAIVVGLSVWAVFEWNQ